MPDSTQGSVVHRIDPRLVHATLLEAWVPHLQVERLVVADAAVAADLRRRTIFALSARDLEQVDFVAERDVAQHLRERAADTRLVVYSSLEGFSEALDGGLRAGRVILGHLPDGEARRRVHPSVYLGKEDLEVVERLRARGIDVVVRPLPSDTPRLLERGEDLKPVLTEDLETPDLIPPEPAAARLPSVTPAYAPPQEPAGSSRTLCEGAVEVRNERGLHLRAAHLLASTASRFAASVAVGWPGQHVNAKSLLGITTLGAGIGSQLELRVEGEDAEAAYAAIHELFASGFREGVE